MATLAIFDWPGAVKNACWGASPNPALWDKMSQRGWLRHRHCRGGSLFKMCQLKIVTVGSTLYRNYDVPDLFGEPTVQKISCVIDDYRL